MSIGKLELIENIDGYTLYKYTPTLFHLFGKYYPEKISIRRIVRFLMAMPCGYEIYYLVKDKTPVAYCTIQSGKSPRFNYSDEHDIIVGPYFVVPEYRGKSIATSLINAILKAREGTYNNAYAYIKKDNMASIKTCEKIGFTYYSDAILTQIKADVKKTSDKNSQFLIMKYTGEIK